MTPNSDSFMADPDLRRGHSAEAAALPDAASRRHQARMDREYRYVRHSFDLTRRFFLFGRDAAVAAMQLKPGDTVLEIGCGTGRNLERIARLTSAGQVTGLDISTEMLKSAERRVRKLALQGRVQLVHADATRLPVDPRFPGAGFSGILMSYSLSMVPDWRAALHGAIARLAPGGVVSIVDFGDFSGFPRPIAGAAIGMLSRHDAPPCLDLAGELQAIAGRDAALQCHHRGGLCGFHQFAVIRRLEER